MQFFHLSTIHNLPDSFQRFRTKLTSILTLLNQVSYQVICMLSIKVLNNNNNNNNDNNNNNNNNNKVIIIITKIIIYRFQIIFTDVTKQLTYKQRKLT